MKVGDSNDEDLGSCLQMDHSLLFICCFFFQHAFDHNKARNEGVILPKPGNNPSWGQFNKTFTSEYLQV